MKCGLALLASALLLGCSPTITVYSNGVDLKIVDNSCRIWQQVKEIDSFKWVTVDTPRQADLLIYAVPANSLRNPLHLGEFHYLEKTIFVNKDTLHQLCEKRITNLIAHEIGHFLYLDHNTQTNSLMNQRANMFTRKITPWEANELKYSKYKFLFVLHTFRLTNALSDIN